MISVAPVDICCHDDPILIYHICRWPSVEWIFDKSQLLWRRFQVNTDILAKADGPGFTTAISANSIKVNTDVSNEDGDQLVLHTRILQLCMRLILQHWISQNKCYKVT